jgi:hypothetical protein
MFEAKTPLSITPDIWRRAFAASIDRNRGTGVLPSRAPCPFQPHLETITLDIARDNGYARAIESLLARAKLESVSRRERTRMIEGYIQECECARRFSLTICEYAEKLSEQVNETVASLIHKSRLLGEQQSLTPRRLDEWPKYISAHYVANLMLEDIEAYEKDQSDTTRQAEHVLNELRSGCASVITTIDQLCLT